MIRLLLLSLTTVLLSSISSNAENFTSILKNTKDTVNKIEIRNREQCDKESEIFLHTSDIGRDFCDYAN